jgi:hypothetical protein
MESAQVFKMLTGLVRGVHLIARTAYGLNLYWFNLVRYPLHHKNFLCPYRNHVPMQFLKARAYGVGRANMICLLSFDLIIQRMQSRTVFVWQTGWRLQYLVVLLVAAGVERGVETARKEAVIAAVVDVTLYSSFGSLKS